MFEWYSIETAPKDGTKILSWNGKYISVSRWDDDRYSMNPKPHFESEIGRLFGKKWDKNFQPTHWMPLPEPPK